VIVPTVDRGLLLTVFWSIATDRDTGPQASDLRHVGSLDFADELTCVDREAVEVASSALGVDGIEGERALTRATGAGEHGQSTLGDRERDRGQVMLTRLVDDDVIESAECQHVFEVARPAVALLAIGLCSLRARRVPAHPAAVTRTLDRRGPRTLAAARRLHTRLRRLIARSREWLPR